MNNTYIPLTQAQHEEMHTQSEAIASAEHWDPRNEPCKKCHRKRSDAKRCLDGTCCHNSRSTAEPVEAYVHPTAPPASDAYIDRMAARLANTKHPKHNLYTKVEHGVIALTWTGMSEITVAYFDNIGTMSKVESFDTDQEKDARDYHQFLVDGLKPIKVGGVNDAKSFIAFLDQHQPPISPTSVTLQEAESIISTPEAHNNDTYNRALRVINQQTPDTSANGPKAREVLSMHKARDAS